MIVIVVGQIVYTIWTDRTTTLDHGAQTVTDLSVVLGEYTAQYVKTIDLSLAAVQAEIKHYGVNSADTFQDRQIAPAIHAAIVKAAEGLPKNSAVTLIGLNGQVLDTSREPDRPFVNLADRDFFIHFRDHDDGGLYIGVPARSKVTDAWVMPLTRRINGPGGRFLGVVAAAVDIQYLRDFYRARESLSFGVMES
jgi:hypothetical protein